MIQQHEGGEPMKNFGVLLIVAALMMVVAMPRTWAQIDERAVVREGEQVVDVGNKTCLVMDGMPVSGQDFVEYKGKRYGLCCSGCKVKFELDPESYITQYEASQKKTE